MTLTVPAHDPAARDKPAGRIRQKNEEAILAAAEEEFARHGFKGTSMNTIAQNVGLPKANLHYYFGNKLGLYTAVLSNILELWDSTFNTLGVDDDPAEALARYIRAKMEFSRRYPLASRIFAMEIISGGECLTAHFNQDYRSWFRGRAAVFEAWIARRPDGPGGSRAPDLPALGQHPALRRLRQPDRPGHRPQAHVQAGLRRRRRQPGADHPQGLRTDPAGGLNAMPSTLQGLAEYREEIRKSRFHTIAAPVADEDEAQAFIAAHRDASAGHNCWAWKCGAQYRFSDDGEPGGSAGRPILAAIEGQDMDCVAVLVSRWFGGIKLGTGGLARAYGGGAAKCLQQAPRSELVERCRVRFACAFADHALLKARSLALGASVAAEDYGADGVVLTLELPVARFEALQALLVDLSRGQVRLQRLDA